MDFVLFLLSLTLKGECNDTYLVDLMSTNQASVYWALEPPFVRLL